MSHQHPGFDINEVGFLDTPDDHPDEYTGTVESFTASEDPDTSAVALWAPTKNGQPVPLCTINVDDISRQISFDAPWCIAESDADDRANDMHEAVVAEITQRMAVGDLFEEQL